MKKDASKENNRNSESRNVIRILTVEGESAKQKKQQQPDDVEKTR